MRVYYSLVVRHKTRLYRGLSLCDFLYLFRLIYVCCANVQCSELMLDKVRMFFHSHGVNIKCLRTVGSGMTSLPTSVAHYWIWASSLSRINVHCIGVSWWPRCKSNRWSHSCHMDWGRVYRFGNPCDRVVIGSNSSGGSGLSGSQSRLECRVHNAIFIAEDCSTIPILGDIIRRSAIGETGNVVLYDGAQPMSEFQHNVHAFSVLCTIY